MIIIQRGGSSILTCDSLFSREKWDQSPPFSVTDVRTVSFRLDGKCLDMEVEVSFYRMLQNLAIYRY